MSDTCGGKCCSVFVYPSTPEELRTRTGATRDDLYIADMLIPCDSDEVAERAERFKVNPPDGIDLVEMAADGVKFYTCKHWDEETRLCGAYEERPTMCREYPYAGKCEHDCECSYVAPKHTRTKWHAVSVKRAFSRSDQP